MTTGGLSVGTEQGKKRTIGLWSAISIGVGGMVGAGIFSILGIAGQIAGNKLWISFLIAGLIALLSTYSYAKLGVTFPSVGGPVDFLVKGFGNGIFSGGFTILLWLGYVFALALYAKAFAGYTLTFFPAGTSDIWRDVLVTGIILFFIAINFFGAQAVGRSEFFIVLVKVAILFLFSAAGAFFVRSDLLSLSDWPHPNNLFFGAAIVFLAYEGFGLITNAAEDMQNPSRTLPKALYLSVIIVIGVYITVSLVVAGNLSVPEIIRARDYALAEAARPFLGQTGFKIIALAALFSTSSAINATLYGGANVSYMIAREGQLPSIFERKVWGRSREGLFITGGLVILFANVLPLDGIAMLGSAAFLLIYASVNASHLRLCTKTGANRFLVWLSTISCLVCLGVLVFYEKSHSPITLIVFACVIVFSFIGEWMFRKYSHRDIETRSRDQQDTD